ncbi:Cysteine--tRNA ligase 2, cytoplasmic, partial [Camellia lanceoleosa]
MTVVSELAAKGIAFMDVGKETIWRPCVPVQEQTSLPVAKDQPSVADIIYTTTDVVTVGSFTFYNPCWVLKMPWGFQLYPLWLYFDDHELEKT